MSDPVTQAEIEDVLSSIRRLVSEDGRSVPRPVPVQETPKPKPASRLVLTPALRVSEPIAEEPDATQPQLSAEVPAVPDRDEREGAPVLDQGIDHDIDFWDGEDQAEATEAEGVLGSTENHEDATTSDVAASQAGFEDLEPGEVLFFQPDEEEAGGVEASAELATSEPEMAPNIDTTSEADAAPWRQPGATLFAAVDSTDHVATETATAEPEPVDRGDAAEVLSEEAGPGDRVSAVVQKIAELEAKVARSDGQWEPDGASSDPYAGTNIETLAWQDHIEDQTDSSDFLQDEASVASEIDRQELQGESAAEPDLDAATLAEEAVTEEALDGLQGFAGEESYLDEDSLRELVADIVRSELQGALGERITRNVRKLVRREIQRALAAQDLL
ncbi:hypothetical protein [Pseudophaeobacter sp.]|uniref:hypothetical protein n=1 Tax=Pseudophaeobacter sp. TaxID=1971739 RepID=UPI0032987F3D